MSLPPVPLDAGDPACLRCSKPVAPGASVEVPDGIVHLRCLAEDKRGKALAAQDRASYTRAQARETREAVKEIRGEAKGLARGAKDLLQRVRSKLDGPGTCPVCLTPLARGDAVIFRRDELVHAGCWQLPESDAPKRG
jgi:hypothetical protein